MSLLQDIVTSASVALGNVASRERDRQIETRHEDGRPKAVSERAAGRVQAVMAEGATKVVVAEVAHLGAKELAKRVTNEGLKRIFGALGRRPVVAAGTVLFAADAAREGYRLVKGEIDGGEFAERVGGNAVGIVGAAAGSYIGAAVGTVAMPIVGTAVGSVIGGVVGGVGGDTYGRRQLRNVIEKFWPASASSTSTDEEDEANDAAADDIVFDEDQNGETKRS